MAYNRRGENKLSLFLQTLSVFDSEEVNTMSDPNTPGFGDVIIYVDEVSVQHYALVTQYWGGDQPNMALNCVYVSSDESKKDPNGRQIERASSVSRQSEHTAHGRYWKPIGE
jgi:hypothetical protein